ncbi:MAG: hypothetical protein ACI37Z_07395 [Candidatus Gastranaerophilaceae bacterium]
MELSIDEVKNIFAKIAENIYFKKFVEFLFKIYNSPFLFTLVLLLLVFIVSFGFCHPFYQNCDDDFMRSIIDGSYGATGEPRAYAMWQHILYTTFLQKLYIKFPHMYWYDIFTYTFMSLSLVVTTLCLYSKDGKHKDIFNLFLFLTSFFIYSVIFIYPQFSITAGSLTVAGVILGYYTFLNNQPIFRTIFNLLLMSGMFLLAALIRSETLFVLMPLSVFISFLLLKKENTKKYTVVAIDIVLVLLLSFMLRQAHLSIINANPEYKKVYETHMERLNISERTPIFKDKLIYLNLWSKLEAAVDLDKKLSPIGWDKESYRISLTWLDWGDEDIFNIEKMKQVKNILEDNLSIKTHINFSFEIADYSIIYKYYFAMLGLLFLIFPSKSAAKRILLMLLVYFAFIMVANNVFKVFPPRIWINFVNLLVLSGFLILKNNFNDFLFSDFIIEKFSKKFSLIFQKKYISLVLLILVSVLYSAFSVKPLLKIERSNLNKYKAYKSSLSVLKNLSKDKVYIVDIFMQELYSKPFSKNMLKYGLKVIPMACMFTIESKEILAKYNIPLLKTLKTVCERDDIFYYTHLNQPYQNFFVHNNKIALSSFMRKKYKEEIAFLPIEYPGPDAVIYDIVVLTPEQIDLRNKTKYLQCYWETDFLIEQNEIYSKLVKKENKNGNN